MTIFNSLGSNYTLSSAMRMLFSIGGTGAKKDLINYLEKRYGGRATLTYKGREAMVLALCALPEKGAVAVNGYTCFAVYDAITRAGFAPHYVDIAEGSLDFSAAGLGAALDANPSIKAVIVQNTLGIPCDIAPIAKLCRERGLALIEDLAHSIGARYGSGEEAGTVGDLTVLSFSQDKVVDAVSGGALIVRAPSLCKSDLHKQDTISLAAQLKDRVYPIITWKVRALYSVGVGKLYHKLLRALHVLSTPFGTDASDVHELPGWYCGNIMRQYRALDATAAHRRTIADTYAKTLNRSLRIEFSAASSANIRFPVLTERRDALIEHLRAQGVHVSDIWYDAPIAPKKYLDRTDYRGECPNAQAVSDTMLNLSTHLNVSPAQAYRIARSVDRFLAPPVSYEIRPVRDEREWENFLRAQHPHSFLHSWTWGEENEATGSRVFRLGAYAHGQLVGVALFIRIAARRGSFLLCPHGPAIDAAAREDGVLATLVGEAERIARTERCAFIRLCPLAPSSPAGIAMYRDMGFRDAPIHMHPELSWMLDISAPEEQLLKEMRKTTRYLIKKMEKDGVTVATSADPGDIERFWPVYEATVRRQHFTPFKKSDLRTEFERFAARGQAAFFFGEQAGEIVAAAIIIFYNGQAFYHHSGSLSSGSNVSYLLQWRVIQEAKRRGCTLYNFWGISPEDKPKHPWAGLSLFKKGFGGFAEEYLHAQDKPLAAKYWVNYIVETVRRIRRGL